MLKKELLGKSKKIAIQIKVTEEEWEAMKKNAKKYSNGKLSPWIRYSAINHTPAKKHLEN